MSEHDSHDDPALSELYRRAAREEPSAHLDERVLATARRHAKARSHRWWVPLSTAAVLVLTVSLLLRHQQAPVEVQRDYAKYEEAPAASEPLPAPAPAAPAPAFPRKEKPVSAAPAPTPQAAPQTIPGEAESRMADAEAARPAPAATEKRAQPLNEGAAVEGLARAPAEAAEQKQANVAASAAAPRAKVEMQPQPQPQSQLGVLAEAPEPWLKRIEALRVKGELEAAKRELTAFRKAYPNHALPRELQALLPEAK